MSGSFFFLFLAVIVLGSQKTGGKPRNVRENHLKTWRKSKNVVLTRTVKFKLRVNKLFSDTRRGVRAIFAVRYYATFHYPCTKKAFHANLALHRLIIHQNDRLDKPDSVMMFLEPYGRLRRRKMHKREGQLHLDPHRVAE